MNEVSFKVPRPRVWLQGAAVLAALLLVLVAGGGSVGADSPNTACIRDAINKPTGEMCTANDVRVAAYIAPPNPPPCVLGSTVTIPNLRVKIESGPDRYDIGLWVDQQGFDALSLGGFCATPSLTGGYNQTTTACTTDGNCATGDVCVTPVNRCFRDYLHPVSTTNTDVNLPSGVGPYFNGELATPTDICGDVPAVSAWTVPTDIGSCTGGGGNCVFTYHNIPSVTIKCVDSNNDGQIDIGACASWDNQANNKISASCGFTNTLHPELDTNPSTSSKCNCNRANVTGLLVPGRIIVDKVTYPGGDPTLFPFTLTGPGTNLPFSLADATAAYSVAVNPGTYTVVEGAVVGDPNWALFGLVCVDPTSNTTVDLSTGTATINVVSNETVTCTFYNSRPTAVDVRSFTATRTKRAVTLKWEAASDAVDQGFNLYRAKTADGERTKINAELIPAQFDPSTPSVSYEFTDRDFKGQRPYYYWLESVSLSGRAPSALHGPIEALAK